MSKIAMTTEDICKSLPDEEEARVQNIVGEHLKMAFEEIWDGLKEDMDTNTFILQLKLLVSTLSILSAARINALFITLTCHEAPLDDEDKENFNRIARAFKMAGMLEFCKHLGLAAKDVEETANLYKNVMTDELCMDIANAGVVAGMGRKH